MKFIILIPIFASWHAMAESVSPDGNSSTAAGRSAWFIYTSLPETIENSVKVMSADGLIEVTLSKRNASGPVRIPQDGRLRVVREEPDPDKTGESVMITIAEAQIPEGVQNALVVLVPLKEPAGHKRFMTQVQSLSEFNGGDWMFMNITNAEIGIKLGESRTVVKPGSIGIRKNSDLAGPMNLEFSYNYRLAGEADWRLLTASTAFVMPTRREICIFSVNPRSGRITYNGTGVSG